MIKQTKNFNSISHQVNSLNIEQVSHLFNVYYNIQYHCNFFMSQETYSDFLLRFHNTPNKYTPLTFKTLIVLLTTIYTNESRYSDLLETINLIKNNYSLFEIINILYQKR